MMTGLRASLLTGILMLALSGCGQFMPEPDAEAAREVERLLVFEPFGGARFEVSENEILVSASGEAEAGVFLRASEKVTKPVIVRFAYRDPAPLNLRLTQADGHKYFSASAETMILLGPGQASEALFYGAGPLDFSIEVEDVSACGKDNLVCTAEGEIEQTFSGSGLKDRLLINTYNNAHLEHIGRRSASIVRKAPQGEYGVSFTLLKDGEDKNYVLEFEVDSPETVQLRVEREGQLRYYSATRGWARINQETEVLLFSGENAEIEVKNVRLTDCQADEWRCKTAEDFEDLLPGDLSDTSTERLVSLTEWVTRNADYAASESVANSIEVTGLTASQMYYKYYEPNRAGGFCGATAVFLSRTLRSQGFETFTIDFGLRDGHLTHVTTIIVFEDQFFLMDATFGAYFAVPGTNQPIDLFKLLDGAPYDFRTLDMSGRDFIVAKDDKVRLRRMKDMNLVDNCETSKDYPVIVCNRPNFGLDAYLESFSAALRENNLESSPQTLIELLKRGVFSIGASEDTDAMRRFARELDARGIELLDTPGQTSPSRLLQVSEP